MPWAASIRMNADRGLGSRFLRCVAPQPLVFRHWWYCRFTVSGNGYCASFYATGLAALKATTCMTHAAEPVSDAVAL